MIAPAQKPDFVFRRNGRVHFNRQGRQFSRVLATEVCASAVVMLDAPSYPLHSPVSPSHLRPCVTVCHQVSTAQYVALIRDNGMVCEPLIHGSSLTHNLRRRGKVVDYCGHRALSISVVGVKWSQVETHVVFLIVTCSGSSNSN